MKIGKVVLSITAVLLAGWIGVFFSDEWNRAGIGSEGRIEEGKRFGLTIGDGRDVVRAKLEQRGLIDTTSWGQNEVHYNRQKCGILYPEEYIVESWWDDSWRKGGLCLAFEDEKLASIGWYFNFLSP
jgi:hypothetical protein